MIREFLDKMLEERVIAKSDYWALIERGVVLGLLEDEFIESESYEDSWEDSYDE